MEQAEAVFLPLIALILPDLTERIEFLLTVKAFTF
jgi:hypothetical protein